MDFVLDASIALRWLLVSQQTSQSALILDRMSPTVVHVPSIWPVEIVSVATRELNRGSITLQNVRRFLELLSSFNIHVATVDADVERLFRVAQTHRLAPADATYVDLALTYRLPLASADDQICKAAALAGVPLVVPPPA